MDFRSFVKNQIEKGNKNWESRSALIRVSGEKANGHNNRILKEYEDKFLFGPIADLKNKEIKKYFDKQSKNSLISVEGAVKIINQNLPKGERVSTTLIYSRLKDQKFNTSNLKGQTLDNQVSKFGLYDVKITKEFEEKVIALRDTGIYLSIENTQRGSKIIRLKTSKEYGNLDKSYPPNENSIKIIKKLIDEKDK